MLIAINLIPAIFLLGSSVSAIAKDSFDKPIMRISETHRYMVSAILRKNDQQATVKLIQSIEQASSKEEASGILFKNVRSKFDGYAVLDTIITIVPESSDSCKTWL